MKLTTIANRLISGKSNLFRRLTTATSPTPPPAKPAIRRRNFNKHNLYKRLSSVGATGERVTDVLHQMLQNGEQFTRSDLISCVKDLRKHNRFHHCLEILEWMDEGKYSYADADYADADYALRLNIMCKLKGIDEVEMYFDSIPPNYKNQYTYGALLNCYCTNQMTDDAFALFKAMDKLNYTSNALAYNNLMGLSLKIGKPEKVPYLVEEMKQRNIQLTNYTYYLWIQSYRNAVDLEGVERVMQEVEVQDSLKDDWSIYSNLVSVYTEVGQSEKAITALIKMGEILDKSHNPDRKGYHYLISGYSNMGKLESVYEAWHKLKSRFGVCLNTSYLIMLQSLSKLDDVEGLRKIFNEWKLSSVSYDDRLPTGVIGAYLRHDMLEEAGQLLEDVIEKDNASGKKRKAHVVFMKYFLGKHQFDSALMHMEAAIASHWKPVAENLVPFFQHFEEEKDVDSAEEFCRRLEEVQALDSITFLWLLRTYAASGKTAPDIRQRMKRNGVDISAEHEDLLQKLC